MPFFLVSMRFFGVLLTNEKNPLCVRHYTWSAILGITKGRPFPNVLGLLFGIALWQASLSPAFLIAVNGAWMERYLHFKAQSC